MTHVTCVSVRGGISSRVVFTHLSSVDIFFMLSSLVNIKKVLYFIYKQSPPEVIRSSNPVFF